MFGLGKAIDIDFKRWYWLSHLMTTVILEHHLIKPVGSSKMKVKENSFSKA